MARIKHPAFPDVEREVKAYAAWRDQGWVIVDEPSRGKRERRKAPAEDAGDDN